MFKRRPVLGVRRTRASIGRFRGKMCEGDVDVRVDSAAPLPSPERNFRDARGLDLASALADAERGQRWRDAADGGGDQGGTSAKCSRIQISSAG